MGAAAVAGVLVMTIGVALGSIAGYFGGLLDALIMRVVDLALAFPNMVLAFAVVAILRPGLVAVLLGFVTVWWAGYARITRSLVISLRDREYVQAARVAGASNARVIARHILPNVAPSVVVLVTTRIGRLMLAIAGLSFLGLGSQPPTPEWGSMLSDALPYFPKNVMLLMAPGVAITLVVLGLSTCWATGCGTCSILDAGSSPHQSGKRVEPRASQRSVRVAGWSRLQHNSHAAKPTSDSAQAGQRPTDAMS